MFPFKTSNVPRNKLRKICVRPLCRYLGNLLTDIEEDLRK